MKLNFILPVIASFLVTACAVTPEPTPEKFYIIRGTAVGDPCSSERMYIDTPRGFPRICINGKWVPLCELSDLNPTGHESCVQARCSGAMPGSQ